MAFDKELAILYGFFNLRISAKTTLLEKIPNDTQNFLVLNFCFILYQNSYNILQNCQILRFGSI